MENNNDLGYSTSHSSGSSWSISGIDSDDKSLKIFTAMKTYCKPIEFIGTIQRILKEHGIDCTWDEIREVAKKWRSDYIL